MEIIKSEAHVISGGSIWCDHIAVTLFLKGYISKLTLHLPDHWSFENRAFAEKTFAGKTLNKLHQQFSKILGRDTLHEIDDALKRGAHFTTSTGFFERNTSIARNSNVLYAIVMENSAMTPGTKNTWNKFTGQKFILYV